jgi:hypothetical protein
MFGFMVRASFTSMVTAFTGPCFSSIWSSQFFGRNTADPVPILQIFLFIGILFASCRYLGNILI